ncbi:MAG: hypothetical protein WC262_08430 [Bacteroidales bacterium]|jgi:hypothetical protein
MSQTLQMIKWSKTYGGARNVFTGSAGGVTSGQYFVDLTTLPDGDTGCIPAGTPILINDDARTIAIHYAFELYEEKATGTEATFQAKIKKGFEGSRIQAGMILGAAPSTLANLSVATTAVYTVGTIDRTTSALYDIVTVTNPNSGGDSATLAAGAVFIEMSEDAENAGDYYATVLPNGFTFYDVSKHDDAVLMYGVDGLFCQINGVLLTRRIPPIADSIREYMRSKDVYVRYSVSKE